MTSDPEPQLEALTEAFGALGVRASPRRRRGSLVVRWADGAPVEIGVRRLSTVRPGVASTIDAVRPIVVVAERVPAAQREELDRAGIGWLDRRGHLKLRHANIWIDADVPPSPAVRRGLRTDRLRGPVVMGVALAALLAFPEPLRGVRELARRLDASPGGVSQAEHRLVESGLLTQDRRAAVPGLFWSVTESWAPRWHPLSVVPDPEPGLLAVGTRAAVALHAPVVSSRGQVVDLLARDGTQYRRIVRMAGAPSGARTVARLALVPAAGEFADPESTARVDGHGVAAAVVVAASIAVDPARGAEVVERWELPDRAW